MTSKMIFISHSTKDDAQIDHISESLTKAGHGVWVDHRNGITPGTPSWDKAIRDAIKNADVGVFVMSEHALESDICGSECLLIRELNKPLYVLRLTVCKPENIFLYIKQIQYADLVTDFEAGMQTFLDVLGGGIAQNLPTPSRAKITGGETMRQYLPFLNNPLRGRDDDLATIQTMLTQAGITQIIGVGGWGKSRISAEIALAYPQGAVWHRCSSVSSAGDLLYTLRRHFDLPDDIPQDNILVLLDTHRPLVVIDNAEDVAPKSDRRAGYVDLLGKIAGLGVPVLLTSRIVWDELKPRKQYPPPALNGDIAQTITADFAESQNISLTPDQISELTRASRNHPRLMELAVALLQEALPYERLIKRLNDLSHDDMQDALNEMILKTVDQMRHEAKHGETAYALLRNLTWLQATFPYEAIIALKPAGLSDDDLDDAITTLGRYTFLGFERLTKRYSLGSLVREALGQPNDDNIFNAYADFYMTYAEIVFKNLRNKTELWGNYYDDIENIIALGNKLAKNLEDNIQKNLESWVKFMNLTLEYITEWRPNLYKWLDISLQTLSFLGTNIEDNFLLKYKANILRGLGMVSNYHGNIEMALQYYEESLAISHELGDKFGEASTINNIGATYKEVGKSKLALSYYKQAIKLLNKFKDSREKALTLNNIGVIWSDRRNFEKAIIHYEQALSIADMIGDKRTQARILNNIGTIWGDYDNVQKDFQKALSFYQRSLLLCNETNDKLAEIPTLISIGNLWDYEHDFQQAFNYYRRAMSLCEEIGDKELLAKIYYNMGISYAFQQNIDKAIEYFEIAIQKSRPYNPDILRWQEELELLRFARENGE